MTWDRITALDVWNTPIVFAIELHEMISYLAGRICMVAIWLHWIQLFFGVCIDKIIQSDNDTNLGFIELCLPCLSQTKDNWDSQHNSFVEYRWVWFGGRSIHCRHQSLAVLYSTDLRALWARIIMRSSYSQLKLSVSGVWTQFLTVARPALYHWASH